jgi:hypothetical protein
VVLHDWSIEEREYLRQEARRGRRHAFDATLCTVYRSFGDVRSTDELVALIDEADRPR